MSSFLREQLLAALIYRRLLHDTQAADAVD